MSGADGRGAWLDGLTVPLSWIESPTAPSLNDVLLHVSLPIGREVTAGLQTKPNDLMHSAVALFSHTRAGDGESRVVVLHVEITKLVGRRRTVGGKAKLRL